MENEIVKVENNIVTQQNFMQPKDLSIMIDNEVAIRKLIKKFVSSQLVDGVDYGKIHVVSKDKCPDYYNGCQNPNHYSKDTLFKAGAEKFTSLFHLKPVFEIDKEIWEIMGKTPGTFCFICKLVNNSGEIVAEGRGMCSVQEKYGQANNALKIAEKRAQLDAVLRHGGLSDFFTQDMEDTEFDQGKKKIPAKMIQQPVQMDIVNPIKTSTNPIKNVYKCSACKNVISEAEQKYSKRIFKKDLCRDCQKLAKG